MSNEEIHHLFEDDDAERPLELEFVQSGGWHPSNLPDPSSNPKYASLSEQLRLKEDYLEIVVTREDAADLGIRTYPFRAGQPLVVKSVVYMSFADQQEIRRGDKIVSLNDHDYEKWVSRWRGKPNLAGSGTSILTESMKIQNCKKMIGDMLFNGSEKGHTRPLTMRILRNKNKNFDYSVDLKESEDHVEPKKSPNWHGRRKSDIVAAAGLPDHELDWHDDRGKDGWGEEHW